MLCVQRDRVEGCGIKMAFPSGAVNVMDFPVKCHMTSLVWHQKSEPTSRVTYINLNTWCHAQTLVEGALNKEHALKRISQ